MGAIPTGSGVGVEGGSEVKDESKVGKKLDVEGLSFKILSGTYVKPCSESRYGRRGI